MISLETPVGTEVRVIEDDSEMARVFHFAPVGSVGRTTRPPRDWTLQDPPPPVPATVRVKFTEGYHAWQYVPLSSLEEVQ